MSFNRYELCVNKITLNSFEDEKNIYEDRECMISNYGRVTFKGEFYKLKRKLNNILNSKYISYRDMVLTREFMSLNSSEKNRLIRYIFYADKFLLFLIENDFNNFNTALKEFNRFENFEILSYKEKISLLKPVYYRYTKKSSWELKNLQIELRRRLKVTREEKIEEYKLPKKIVLYNVSYELIEYSYLKILGELKINLKDSIFSYGDTYILGNIREFDKVEIEIYQNEYETSLTVKLYYQGIYLE